LPSCKIQQLIADENKRIDTIRIERKGLEEKIGAVNTFCYKTWRELEKSTASFTGQFIPSELQEFVEVIGQSVNEYVNYREPTSE